MRRFDMRLPALVRLDRTNLGGTNADQENEFQTETQNVSARGVFFYLDRPVPDGNPLRSHSHVSTAHHADRRGPGTLHGARDPRGFSTAFIAHRNRRHDRRLRIPALHRQHRFPQRTAAGHDELKAGFRLRASALGQTSLSAPEAKMPECRMPLSLRQILHPLPQPAVAPHHTT